MTDNKTLIPNFFVRVFADDKLKLKRTINDMPNNRIKPIKLLDDNTVIQ